MYECIYENERVLRDYEFEHGHYVDLAMYSILKREFDTLESKASK